MVFPRVCLQLSDRELSSDLFTDVSTMTIYEPRLRGAGRDEIRLRPLISAYENFFYDCQSISFKLFLMLFQSRQGYPKIRIQKVKFRHYLSIICFFLSPISQSLSSLILFKQLQHRWQVWSHFSNQWTAFISPWTLFFEAVLLFPLISAIASFSRPLSVNHSVYLLSPTSRHTVDQEAFCRDQWRCSVEANCAASSPRPVESDVEDGHGWCSHHLIGWCLMDVQVSQWNHLFQFSFVFLVKSRSF